MSKALNPNLALMVKGNAERKVPLAQVDTLIVRGWNQVDPQTLATVRKASGDTFSKAEYERVAAELGEARKCEHALQVQIEIMNDVLTALAGANIYDTIIAYGTPFHDSLSAGTLPGGSAVRSVADKILAEAGLPRRPESTAPVDRGPAASMATEGPETASDADTRRAELMGKTNTEIRAYASANNISLGVGVRKDEMVDTIIRELGLA